MSASTLMVQGTSSSVGKSLLVAALCRIFARRGVRVAPFKAQNMSNNAAVCADGSEIGRSQAVQAVAARVSPTPLMNPILLKPEADSRSQVIVNGRTWRTLDARAYYRHRDELWPMVTASVDRLRQEFELLIIEGAGSPAELNLRGYDIVNMAVARYCEAPVILVGDIDRGGVFAQLLGTLSLLDETEQSLVRGLIVNRFRGDRTLFESGITILERRSRRPVLGVVPWLTNLNLPEEDSHPLETTRERSRAARTPGKHDRDSPLDIAVIHLPRLANFDDFDPLASEPRVSLRFVTSPTQLNDAAAIILPGSKSTVSDLKWLRESGLAERIVQLGRAGRTIVGICGGYQMLGQEIIDVDHVESSCDRVAGLGLLQVRTVFSSSKATHLVSAVIQDDRHCRGCLGAQIGGYEIHMGHTQSEQGWLNITERSGSPVSIRDGAVSVDGQIWGCYLHGLFANESFRRAWLSRLDAQSAIAQGADSGSIPGNANISQGEHLDTALDRLADEIESALDMNRLQEIIWERKAQNTCLRI